MIHRIGQSYQVALPRELVAEMGLKIGDYLEIRVEGGRIILEPQVLVPKSQAYFYTADWQKDEQKASDDIGENRTTKTKNIKELFRKLDAP